MIHQSHRNYGDYKSTTNTNDGVRKCRYENGGLGHESPTKSSNSGLNAVRKSKRRSKKQNEEDRRYSVTVGMTTTNNEEDGKRKRRSTSVWGRDNHNDKESTVEVEEERMTTRSNKFLSFFQRGLRLSKSVSRLDTIGTEPSETTSSSGYSSIVLDGNYSYLDSVSGCYSTPRSTSNNQSSRSSSKTTTSTASVVPIPIRDTAVRMVNNSGSYLVVRTPMLFHKLAPGTPGSTTARAKPLIVLNEHTKITPLHRSLAPPNFPHCFKIEFTPPSSTSTSDSLDLSSLSSSSRPISASSTTSSKVSIFDNNHNNTTQPIQSYLFSCPSLLERKHMLSVLSRISHPDLHLEKRSSISLNLWVQEAKNVPFKKRYFCEVLLDGKTHARTTCKVNTDMLFWGEEIVLIDLEPAQTVSVILWKVPDEGSSRNKKRKSQTAHFVCRVDMNTSEILDPGPGDKWYSGSSSTQDVSSPMIRLKPRYCVLNIEPLHFYSPLLKQVLTPNLLNSLLSELEPHLKVGLKEQIVTPLIRILHHQGKAHDLVSELILQEVSRSQDCNLILRGNTMASKSMEVYLKLVGEKYLRLVLGDFVERVSLGEEDCEVDPQRVPDGGSDKLAMRQRQESLHMFLEMLWAKVMTSSVYFPKDLRILFNQLRCCLPDSPGLCDRLLSASLFLRLICPAILAPSLFGLLPRPPDNPRGARTLTLLAKTLQSLANSSHTKEPYMSFMTTFVDQQIPAMRSFLVDISSHDPGTPTPSQGQVDNPAPDSIYWDNLANPMPHDAIDLSHALAQLHKHIRDMINHPPVSKTETPCLNKLEEILKSMEEQKDTEKSQRGVERLSRILSNPESSGKRRSSLDMDVTPTPGGASCWRAVSRRSGIGLSRRDKVTAMYGEFEDQEVQQHHESSGYQTLSRSQGSVNMENNPIYDGDDDDCSTLGGSQAGGLWSPPSHVKQSVKKCKQGVRQKSSEINGSANIGTASSSRRHSQQSSLVTTTQHLMHTSSSLPSITDATQEAAYNCTLQGTTQHNYLSEPYHYGTISHCTSSKPRKGILEDDGSCKWSGSVSSRLTQRHGGFIVDTDTIIRREMERIDLLREIVPSGLQETTQAGQYCPCNTKGKCEDVQRYLDDAEGILWEVLGAFHNKGMKEQDEKKLRQVLMTNKRLQQSLLGQTTSTGCHSNSSVVTTRTIRNSNNNNNSSSNTNDKASSEIIDVL